MQQVLGLRFVNRRAARTSRLCGIARATQTRTRTRTQTALKSDQSSNPVSSHSKPTPTQVAFAGWQRVTSTGSGTWLRQPPQSRKNELPSRDGYGQPKIELEALSIQTDSSEPVSANLKCTKNKLPLQDGNGQLELKLLTNLTDSSKPVTYAQN